MTLQIAIVDDLAQDRRQLRMQLETWFVVYCTDLQPVITEFSSAEDFLMQGGLLGKYSIAFLDICMHGQNGLEAAIKIKNARTGTKIIFVTTEKMYALEAYSVHPYDFLVKPFDMKRMSKVLYDLSQEFSREEKMLEIRVPFGMVNVPVSQIISVVSRGHSVDFNLVNGNVVTSSSTFSEIEKLLKPYGNFLNINRGVTINMDKALFLREGSVIMSDKVSYPLRVRDQASLIRTFSQYQIRHRMKGM